MRVIKSTTVQQWATGYSDAAGALERWLCLIEEGRWQNFKQLRAVFPSADTVIVASGRQIIVFNIGGNKYRLIAAIHFEMQIVYAMLFLTHAEDDREKWKDVL